MPVLRWHGAGAAAERLAAAGEALRRLTEQEGVEFLATFDIQAAFPIGGPLRGQRGEVDARPHLLALRADRWYASVHTHLRGTAFSLADAVVLTRSPRLIIVAVVGTDRTWYVLSKHPEVAPPDHLDVALAFAAALRALQPRYRALVAANRLASDEAERALLHQLWQLLAPLLGLRYDRVRQSG